jgi:hypothetical protein
VVNVTDGPDVDVRLRPLELRLRHFCVLLDLLVLVKAVLLFQFCRGCDRARLLPVAIHSPVAFAFDDCSAPSS